MKGVGWVAAVRTRVRQRADDIHKLDKRTGITMQQKQRQRIGFGRLDMQKMDRLPVNFGDELRKLVQPGLLRAPIVGCAPVINQSLHIRNRYAAAPVHAIPGGQRFRPVGTRQAVFQIVDRWLAVTLT